MHYKIHEKDFVYLAQVVMSMIENEWPEAYRERIKFMFNNDILSDVKFVVRASQHGDCRRGDSKRSKMAIPAHKFLLSVRSPVFCAMFCGKMAEIKEYIDLPDCDYEGMLEFLRYIYTDTVSLTGSNVMQVAYLAAKYMVPCLAKQCAIYLGRNLDSSNVFGVLKHAQWFANEDLLKYCWDFIDQMTKDVLKSGEFLKTKPSQLEELVKRDTLNIREVELFKAIDCWAENECKKQRLKPDGSTKRRVIGDQIVKNIRFPVMEQSEFMEVVVDSNILTQEETSNVIMKFLGSTVMLDGFPETEREGSLLRCFRYDDSFNVTSCANDPTDNYPVKVTVDKDIILHGISFWCDQSELYATFSVTTNVYHGAFNKDSLLMSHTEMGDVERQHNLYCNYCGFDLLFDCPVALKRNVPYYIVVSFDLPDVSYYYGNDDIIFQTICCGGVTFNFDDEPTVIAEFLFTVDD